jgi:hypothetical protein
LSRVPQHLEYNHGQRRKQNETKIGELYRRGRDRYEGQRRAERVNDTALARVLAVAALVSLRRLGISAQGRVTPPPGRD